MSKFVYWKLRSAPCFLSSNFNIFSLFFRSKQSNGFHAYFALAIMASFTFIVSWPLLTSTRRAVNYRLENRSNGENTLRRTWRKVVHEFMNVVPLKQFATSEIERAYNRNEFNSVNTSVLVRVNGNNISFQYAFPREQHSRLPSVFYIVEKVFPRALSHARHFPHNLTFLVCVSDGNNPTVATFGSARHFKNWINLIPVPMGNDRGARVGWGSSLVGWDKYIESGVISSHSEFPWEEKIPKAMFRGNLPLQGNKLGSCNEQNDYRCVHTTNWKELNRGRMFKESAKATELFDVGFVKKQKVSNASHIDFSTTPSTIPEIAFLEFQKYKLLLNVGTNCDWAERLRMLLLMNSAVVKHEAETMEFFYPLLKPWVHYIPTNLFFGDLIKNIKWSLEHNRATKRIVRNANMFALKYLSERSMELYWEVALIEFSKRQKRANKLYN